MAALKSRGLSVLENLPRKGGEKKEAEMTLRVLLELGEMADLYLTVSRYITFDNEKWSGDTCHSAWH